ncbi:MAG TPA: XRE family transcriptional regulator, partial [Candidatus Dormibacteraeota bacterium]|nr:XRE family transcriptional regulator [Candidatus Dormibacteraeota bacterium]
TAYGIKTMLLLEDGLAADLVPLAESLQQMALRDGGYVSRGQSKPRPETTAAVLSALRRVDVTADFGAHAAQLENGLGDFEKSRPFILTAILETSLLLEPGARLVEVLVDSLLAARRPYGDLLLWPEKAEPLLIDPNPSVAHTARAVRVLASVQAIRPSGQVQEALQQATTWLIEQRDLHNAYEATERPVNGGLEGVQIRHFTAAWVVKALVSTGVPTTHPLVSNALAQIWNSYGGDTAALWAWDNGDLPIWMTFDAIEALRLATLAVPAGHGWSPTP